MAHRTDEEIIRDYLTEARQCEYYASFASEVDRKTWLELALKWRRLASHVAERRARPENDFEATLQTA